jgi:hypothetical protein
MAHNASSPRQVWKSRASRRTNRTTRDKTVEVLTSVATGLSGLTFTALPQHGALVDTTRALAFLCQVSATIVQVWG